MDDTVIMRWCGYMVLGLFLALTTGCIVQEHYQTERLREAVEAGLCQNQAIGNGGWVWGPCKKETTK